MCCCSEKGDDNFICWTDSSLHFSTQSHGVKKNEREREIKPKKILLLKKVCIVSWTRDVFPPLSFLFFRFVLWFPQTVTRQAKVLSDRVKPLRRLQRAKLPHEKEAEIFSFPQLWLSLKAHCGTYTFFSPSIYYVLVFLDSETEQNENCNFVRRIHWIFMSVQFDTWRLCLCFVGGGASVKPLDEGSVCHIPMEMRFYSDFWGLGSNERVNTWCSAAGRGQAAAGIMNVFLGGCWLVPSVYYPKFHKFHNFAWLLPYKCHVT